MFYFSAINTILESENSNKNTGAIVAGVVTPVILIIALISAFLIYRKVFRPKRHIDHSHRDAIQELRYPQKSTLLGIY